MPPRREITWLLYALGALHLAITAIIIWQTGRLLVAPWIITVVALPCAGFVALLRNRVDTIGREGKYVDWWTIPHVIAGVLLAWASVCLAFVVAIAIVWEIVELYARTPEPLTNRTTDVTAAIVGWIIANVLAGGDFPLLP